MPKSNFTIEIKGVKECFDKIKTNFNKAIDECDMEMGNGVEKIVLDAKNLLPANYGVLRSSLNVIKIAKLNYLYGSSINYAAYVEFGTGKYAEEYVPTIDKDWQILAQTYKTTGKGTLPTSQYLYPATIIGQQQILKKLKETIKRYV